MARAKVIHSTDAVLIEFKGNPKNPEPATAVIKFPGGHVEVSRCSDGTYWAHLEMVDPGNHVASRIDYTHGAQKSVADMPDAQFVKKMAIRVSNATPHPDDEY